jgi:D-threo-aldose 1-dehydrogenase
VLAAGVFNSGILADPHPGASYDYAPAPAGLLDRAQRIRIVCARYDVPIGAAAIRFVLRHPDVTAVVVGARCSGGHRGCDLPDTAVPAALFDELAAEHLISMAVDRS